jgi:hypothetical protein
MKTFLALPIEMFISANAPSMGVLSIQRVHADELCVHGSDGLSSSKPSIYRHCFDRERVANGSGMPFIGRFRNRGTVPLSRAESLSARDSHWISCDRAGRRVREFPCLHCRRREKVAVVLSPTSLAYRVMRYSHGAAVIYRFDPWSSSGF